MAAVFAGLWMPRWSRGGICSDNPLARKSDRLGVRGFGEDMLWSSFEIRRVLSFILGEGERPFGVESESERALEGLSLEGVLATSRVGSIAASPVVLLSSICELSDPNEFLSSAAITERPSPPPPSGLGFLRRCASISSR